MIHDFLDAASLPDQLESRLLEAEVARVLLKG